MPQVRLDGLLVEVLDVGGEGPPILLTPSQQDPPSGMHDRFADFADVYRLIAWAPPIAGTAADTGAAAEAGAAANAGAAGDVGAAGDAVRDHAALAMELLHRLGIERAIFVGAGTGALVSLRAALQAPDRVRGLVLFDLPAKDASELARVDELDIPTLLVQAGAPGTRTASAMRALADEVRDLRGVHLFEGHDPALAADRTPVVDPLVRDYLESLPA